MFPRMCSNDNKCPVGLTGYLVLGGSYMKVINLSTYPPRQCGIASFSRDLYDSLAKQGQKMQIVAVTDEPVAQEYPEEVIFDIKQENYAEYVELADYINSSNTGLCIIQHEYGIYGGPDGEYLLAMTEQLKKPYVLVAHTVLTEPSANQHRVFFKLLSGAAGVVGMSRRSIKLMAQIYAVPDSKLHFIHHGVPDFPLLNRDELKQSYDWKHCQVITTFGLIGPGKGLENGIKAIALLKDKYPNILYLIAGQTHPVLQRREGNVYYESLYALAEALGVSQQVFFDKRYLPLDELARYLNLTDIYMTPYPNRQQAVSGTLAYALGCGLAIVATPYEYALEMLQEGQSGLIAEGTSAPCLARALDLILSSPELKQRLEQAAWQLGRQMRWSSVAQQYILLARNLMQEPDELQL